MGVHCTVCILYKTMMINQELGKEGVKKYKGKGGYSAEGLEQRVTYIIRNMFMNYRVKKIAKIYPHEKQLFFLQI